MTLQVQLQSFANSIRAPQNSTDESADTQRRMDIYRSLFFNNVSGFIQNGFPVLYSLYNEEQWQALIRRFFIEHQCSSPYFIHISKEFVEYLSNEYQPVKNDPPFMAELAHYEWLELALSVREVEQPVNYWQQDGIPSQITASPLTELAAYHYPVHQISPDFRPESADSMHYYLLYRDDQHQVQFQHITALSALALQLLSSEVYSFDSLVTAIHQQAPQFSVETLNQGLTPLLTQWLSCGAVIPAESNGI